MAQRRRLLGIGSLSLRLRLLHLGKLSLTHLVSILLLRDFGKKFEELHKQSTLLGLELGTQVLKLLAIFLDFLKLLVSGEFKLVNSLEHVGSADFTCLKLTNEQITSPELLLGCFHSSSLCAFNFQEVHFDDSHLPIGKLRFTSEKFIWQCCFVLNFESS